MKKIGKSFIALIMIFALSISSSIIPLCTSYAQSNPTSKQVTYKNPMYEGLDVKTYSQENDKQAESSQATKEFKSIDKAANYLKGEMVKRRYKVSFIVDKSYSSNVEEQILNKAMEDDGYTPSSEGDYILANLDKYEIYVQKYSKYFKLTYNMKYLSTYSQEKAVNKEVKKVLDKLDVYNEDDYTKVKAVHDYIAKNIKYDNTYKNYSAYDAIINKNVVCQGFSSITCKMLKELDVGVRYIGGKSQGEGHAWNIIKLGKYWYNTDNTWDENGTEDLGKIDYTYFLKGSKTFDKDHTRDAEYKTTTFKKSFPTSSTNYVYKEKSKQSISSIDVMTKSENYYYTGYQIKPSVTVELDGKELKNKQDYTVSYGKNINAGKGTITIKGINNYKGSETFEFDIKKRSILSSKVSVYNIPNQKYTGKQIKPKVTLKQGSKILKENVDYTLEYDDNIKVGTATITISGINNYTDVGEVNFKIVAK